MTAMTAKRLIRAFCLAFGFVGGFVFFEISWAEEVINDNITAIIHEEISRHENPQTLIDALREITSESDPFHQIQLISPWLQGDNPNALHQASKPYLWATLHGIAGNAFKNLHDIHHADNLEQAIHHYQLALQVYTRDDFPQDWGVVQNNLGNTYSNRIRGRRVDNLEQAIIHYQLALKVRSRESSPQDWAITQHNLGTVYQERIHGERTDNLAQAIYRYQLALQILTRAAFPEKWAMTQYMLAVAYNEHIHDERADNLERAIKHAELALEVYTSKNFSQQWAMVQHTLANLYSNRLHGEQAANWEVAIQHYRLALQVYTRQAFPQNWAAIQHNLSVAYNNRIHGIRMDNLEQAIQYAESALQVYTLEAFPDHWASLQNNLASAYSNRVYGNQSDNIERAIKYYILALKVYTLKDFPQDWAMIQTNLGGIYSARMDGKKIDNLDLAIKHSKLALQVYTRETFPYKWAGAQNNLGKAYFYRIRGKDRYNLQQAIQHFQLALQVYTSEVFPEDFVHTAGNLSMALLENRQYSAALIQLLAILETNKERFQLSVTQPEKRRLVEQTQNLFSNAIWAAVRSGKDAQAARLLEWSKIRLLKQHLVLDSVHIQNLPADQLAPLKTLQAEVSDLENWLHVFENQPTFCDVFQDNCQKAMKSLREIDKSISKESVLKFISTMQDSFRVKLKEKSQQLRETLQAAGITATQAPQNEALQHWLATLPPDGALIAPVFSDFGSVVWIAATGPDGKQQILVLPEFSRKDLRAVTRGEKEDEASGYLKAYWDWNRETDASARQQAREKWQTQLTTSLETLRTKLLEPILTRLQKSGIQPGARLFWLPDADSSLLPIHAVMIDGQPLLARYTVHFVPSLYSAYTAQQRLTAKPGERLLAVVNPTQDLKFALAEGALMSRFFPTRKLLQGQAADSATLQQALAAKPAYLHWSTHGSYNWLTPLESGLALANGEHLTLGKLLSQPDFLAGSRLAVLSACETGLTDLNAPAEALGLPAAFLQAGVPGVVSTLWTVNDQSTTLLLVRFYELHRQAEVEPALALAQAQEWLRTATYRDLRDWLSPQVTQLRDSPQLRDIVRLLEDLRQRAAAVPDVTPYRAPYYWAGFVYSGV